jgi:glycosyltransferase involved in cell wall biosynthesis
MKILMVVHGFPPECSGGTESYVLRLARELVALDHKVRVVTGSHEPRPKAVAESYQIEGITVHKIHRSGLYVDDWDKSYAPEIEPVVDGVLEAFRPDVVHIHHWIRLSRNLVEMFHERGVPTVCTLHDLWTTCPIAFRVRHGSFCELPVGAASCHDCAPHAHFADDAENADALELFREDFRNELQLAKRVVVPSLAHRLEVLKHHPSIAGKMRVVPHGAISDLRPHSGTPRAASDKIRAGHWGHLSSLKGVDVLLEATARLPERVKNRFELHVFGKIVYPGEKPVIESLAARSNTILHGPYAPKDLEKQPLDFAIIPTRCSESHSFVLDEAFLLGLPAIVPARGALLDRVGKAGAAFKPEDPDDLARLIAQVVDDPAILDRWKLAIPKLRSLGTHTRELLGVYHDVLSSSAPLPLTPPEVRARRARFRATQIESRNRRMEFLEGDKTNLRRDLDRAEATMRDMQRYHVEKDKVIGELRGRADSIAEELRRQSEVVASANETTSQLAAELGRARLEVNNVVRLAAEHEREVDAKSAAARADHASELARRDELLAEFSRAFESLATRLASAEQAAARAAKPPPREESVSIIDRLKRTAFGDERKHSGRLRVLYVLHQFLPRHVAGTEIYTYNLAREMKARGHRVAIMTCEAHHDRPPFEYRRREQDGLPIHEVVHNYRWGSFEETYDSPRADAIFEHVLDEEMPDVVHIQHLHYFSANFITIAHRRGIRVVYTLHDYSILCARDGQLRRADGEICEDAIPAKCADCIAHFPLDPEHVPARSRSSDDDVVPAGMRQVMRRLRAGLSPVPARTEPAGGGAEEQYVEAAAERLAAWRHAVRGVDLFISPSHFLREIFVQSDMIDPEKIIVSPNGQDLSRFKNAPERVRGDVLRFGYIGSIAEHKGIHVLVEAMNGLVDQPLAECKIYGELAAFVEYTERLKAMNENPRTRLMGAFDNAGIARILSEIDVLVIPSLWFENAPLTIQEAALSRVPVIASDLGGLAEHVVEGQNGLRFYTGDADDLRKKILWFIEDFSRCDQFDFTSVPMVSIQDDAARMEQRYTGLVASS